MQRSAQNVHAQLGSADGVLGRMMQALNSQPTPFKTASYSISGSQKIVDGSIPNPEFIDQRSGIIQLMNYDELNPHIRQILSQNYSQNIFGDTYAQALDSALNSTEFLGKSLTSWQCNPCLGGRCNPGLGGRCNPGLVGRCDLVN